MNLINRFFILFFCTLLSGCGFQLQKNQSFAKYATPLYIAAKDPYSDSVEYLKSILQNTGQKLVDQQNQAAYILEITQDQNNQNLAGVSSTQVRSYTLSVGITAQLRTQDGKMILPDTVFSESRSIVTQSSSAMGNSAEIDSLYQSMRQSAIHALLHRLNSQEIENQLKKTKISKPTDH